MTADQTTYEDVIQLHEKSTDEYVRCAWIQEQLLVDFHWVDEHEKTLPKLCFGQTHTRKISE